LEALDHEGSNPQTWEIQYQIIMALAESEYKDALPYLYKLSSQELEATMLYVALGDAIVRLGRSHPDDPAPLIDLLGSSNRMLIDGGLRATAMLHLVLNPAAVEVIARFLSALDLADPLRFWGVLAAAGWSGPEVRGLLNESTKSPRQDIRKAALAAQKGRYLPVRPL
jgi:hypothetical protein